MAKRRQNGEGTIYQRSNGLWVCEITLGYDENGKRIRKTVSSMDVDKLKKKLNDLRFYNDRQMVVEASRTTLFEWLKVWLLTYKKPTVKPTTYDMYYNAVYTHIKPVLGNYKLDKVNQIAIQRLINDIYAKKDSSKSTLDKVKLTLAQAYDKAVELNILYSNPTKGVIIPAKKKRKAVAFTTEEQQRFIECCDKASTFDNLFIFAFNTGLRLGEIVALTWSDYNMSENTICVNNNLTSVNDYDENGNRKKGTKSIIGTAKTESGDKRIIPLSAKAKEILKLQKSKTTNSLFIFSSTNSTALDKRNIYKAFNKRITMADIKSPVTFHSFRHSFATRLLEKGADIKTVSELLGHKSIQITLDIYGHVGKDLKEKTINLLDD